MTRGCVCLFLVLPTVASAFPSVLTHQGRVLSVDGDPVGGSVSMTVSLYDEADSSSAFWTRSYTDVALEDGYYALRLVEDDNGDSIDSIDLGDGETWLQTVISGQTLGERQQLGSVPYAMLAGGVQLPHAEEGACETAGMMAYDPSTGDMLLCHSGTFQVMATATGGPGGASDTIVGVWNSGRDAEWALLQVSETTPVPNMAAWRALCVGAGLGVPASIENNAHCLAEVGDPRYFVTTECNMLDQGGDTWRANQAQFQSSFSGGQFYFLRYASNSAPQWTRFQCSAGQAGDLSEDTCGVPLQSASSSFSLNAGEWLSCARPH